MANEKLYYEDYIQRKLYQSYEDFCDLSTTAMRRILATRAQNGFSTLKTSETNFPRAVESHKEINFSYSNSYTYIVEIEEFLLKTGILRSLVKAENDRGFIFPAIGQGLFDNYNLTEIIGAKDNFDTPPKKLDAQSNRNYNPPLLDNLLVLANTIFYSNKSTKFVKGMRINLLSELGFDTASPDLSEELDAFWASKECCDYMSAVLASMEKGEIDPTQDVEETFDEILRAIHDNDFGESYKVFLKNPKALKNLVSLKLTEDMFYDIKNLSIKQLVPLINKYNYEALCNGENLDQASVVLTHDEKFAQMDTLTFEVPYCAMPIQVHAPQSISRYLYDSGIGVKLSTNPSLYKNLTRSLVLYNTLEPSLEQNVNEILKNSTLRQDKMATYQYVKWLKKRILIDRGPTLTRSDINID